MGENTNELEDFLEIEVKSWKNSVFSGCLLENVHYWQCSQSTAHHRFAGLRNIKLRTLLDKSSKVQSTTHFKWYFDVAVLMPALELGISHLTRSLDN